MQPNPYPFGDQSSANQRGIEQISGNPNNFIKIMNDLPFVAVDLETTGLIPFSGRIVEVGAVRFNLRGEILGEFHQLVDPGCPIPPDATAVHGLRQSDIEGQPMIGPVLVQLLDFIGEGVAALIAHNAPFDLGFLSVALSRNKLKAPNWHVIDTLSLARRHMSLASYTLESIAGALLGHTSGGHRALIDARLTSELFRRLKCSEPTQKTLEELLLRGRSVRFQDQFTLLEDPPKGAEALWEAIARQEAISILYKGGSDPGTVRTITPLRAIKKSDKVYLEAFCHRSRIDKSYRLDRIVILLKGGNNASSPGN